METNAPTKTISQVFDEFLADQKVRLAHKTFVQYQSIIELYQSYLEGYWPGHDDEYERITKAGGNYCGTFGPEDATEGYDEFLGYFMSNKVMCGRDTMRAAGTVTKKLAKWLGKKGYVRDTEDAESQAAEAARDLPGSMDVLAILNAWLDENSPATFSDEIEDRFWLHRIEPGKLWLQPISTWQEVIGPVTVPEAATALCKPGWNLSGVVARVGKTWRLIIVDSVST